jgi:hypothetical protein
MSTIYTDAAGNKYLGDCRWGNHDINYPSKNFLLSSPLTDISADLTGICSGAGLLYRNVMPQSTINSTIQTPSYSGTLASFGASGDINDRFTFAVSATNNNWYGSVNLYNDSGYTATDNSLDTTNRIAGTYNTSVYGAILGGAMSGPYYAPTAGYNSVTFAGCASNQSLSLLTTQFQLNGSAVRCDFMYACRLQDVNTNFSYYNASETTKSFILSTLSNLESSGLSNGRHYIVSSAKFILQSGRAAYTISCSDGQTPGSQWATDMWVYDNNTTLGDPVIGRVPNMLLGIGTYTYLKPVKIQGSVFPDNGSPWYLPVGTYAGKTLLMRCYSSMS